MANNAPVRYLVSVTCIIRHNQRIQYWCRCDDVTSEALIGFFNRIVTTTDENVAGRLVYFLAHKDGNTEKKKIVNKHVRKLLIDAEIEDSIDNMGSWSHVFGSRTIHDITKESHYAVFLLTCTFTEEETDIY